MALRAKLGALAYDAAGLTPAAAPLVAALLRDLTAANGASAAIKSCTAVSAHDKGAVHYQVGLAIRRGPGTVAPNAFPPCARAMPWNIAYPTFI